MHKLNVNLVDTSTGEVLFKTIVNAPTTHLKEKVRMYVESMFRGVEKGNNLMLSLDISKIIYEKEKQLDIF